MTPEIPRDKVDWYPTIDHDACINDRACLDFCKNEVFTWSEAESRVEVEHPLNCVLGCTSCAQICPVEAILFPDPAELKRTLRRLRAVAVTGGASEGGGGAAADAPPPTRLDQVSR